LVGAQPEMLQGSIDRALRGELTGKEGDILDRYPPGQELLLLPESGDQFV
jgi:hypothetical protein